MLTSVHNLAMNGRVVIGHNHNPEGSGILAQALRSRMGARDIRIMPFTGLCSYYGESGSIMVGFEID